MGRFCFFQEGLVKFMDRTIFVAEGVEKQAPFVLFVSIKYCRMKSLR